MNEKYHRFYIIWDGLTILNFVVCPVQAAMPSAAVNTCESVNTFEHRQTVVWLIVPRVDLCVVMTHTVTSTPW